ncbi:MAG: 30S ribosomal protein S15 [Thermoplasmata archaeon HGW-Thermoplasmata-1]|nr:MAG: 30S ribosomal protein S15 [Thermoplasmata archaeon HGW-Thermoplasmata-1]
MARMHARRKGRSGSDHPAREEHPLWAALEPKEIESKIAELAKEGKTSAMIGTILRDQFAVPDVKLATGKKISKIIAENGLEPRLPEDLSNLIKRAISLREHLAENRKDLHNKRGLDLIEAKIRRLGKYYIREGVLPAGWKYSHKTAKLMVE